MDIDHILSNAFTSLHLRDCVPHNSPDVLMEDRVFEKILDKETSYNDDDKIDKNLFKKTINAICLLTDCSGCPNISKDDFTMFLKIAKMFVLSIIESQIWIIISDTSRKKRSLINHTNVIGKYMFSNKIIFSTNISNLEVIQIDNYIFNPLKIFDIFNNMEHPIQHGIFISNIMKHYNKIAKQLGYSFSKLKVKNIKKKILMVEITFHIRKYR